MFELSFLLLVAVILTAFSFNLQRLYFFGLAILFRKNKSPYTSSYLLKRLFKIICSLKLRAVGIQKDRTVGFASGSSQDQSIGSTEELASVGCCWTIKP